MLVIKRNRNTEKLSKSKIFNSISKANDTVDKLYRLTQIQIHRIANSVIEYCNNLEQTDPIEISFLGDLVEKKMMESGAYEVAKKYITYRYEKEKTRTNNALTEKLMAKNVANQNANVDESSFGGRIGEAASLVMRQYALDHLLSEKSKHNHNNNEIYIHDLDHYAVGDHNCLSIPFDKLLATGFNTRQTDVRPAGSINTAFQLVAVIFQLQSLQQFGGVSATHLDWTMVPYVRKSFWKHFRDGLKYIENKDDQFIGDLNTSMRCEIIDRSIDHELYKKFYNADKPNAYTYALDKTIQELDQAVEGMYHNLNHQLILELILHQKEEWLLNHYLKVVLRE